MKMKMASLLMALMIVVVTAGCGSKNNTGNATASNATASNAKNSGTDAGANQASKDPKDYPTLVWYLPGDPLEDLPAVNEAASKITREKIGANIEMKIIDWGAYQERLNMNMASNAEFDLAFIGFLYPYQKAVDMGGLLELTDLLNKDAKELLATMPDYVTKAVQTDKGIFAIPNQQIMAFGGGGYIRSDLVKKYNIDVASIKSLLDLEPVLAKIRDNEPDLVPSQRLNASSFRNDGDTHYISVNASTIYINDKTNQVLTYYEIPGAKESVQKSHDWYKKGFYRSDLATNITSGGGDSYSKAGKYATIQTTFKPGVEAEIKAETGYEYTYLYRENLIMGHTSPLETAIGVSRTTKYPEEAVKFINLLNTDKEFYNLIAFGIEGKHYTKIDDKHIKLTEGSKYAPNASWKLGNVFNAYLMEGQADDTWEKTKEINDTSIKSPILGIFFNTDDIRTELTQIEKVQKEYLDARVNTGVEDPNGYWDNYIAAMKKAGIEKVKAAYQQQIDAYLKK